MKTVISRTPRYHASQIFPAKQRTSTYARMKSKDVENTKDTRKLAPNSFNGTVIFTKRNVFSLTELELASDLIEIDLQHNKIQNFVGLPSLPNLKFLDLSYNPISSFFAFPSLPHLEEINLLFTPISQNQNYKIALIILLGKTLNTINGERITPAERNLAKIFPKGTDELLRNGWEITPMPPKTEEVPQILASLSINKADAQSKHLRPYNSGLLKLSEYQRRKLQRQKEQTQALEDTKKALEKA